MGTNRCHGVVRLDSLRDLGRHRNHSAFENATHPAARDILQSPVAYYCGVPTLVKKQLSGFTRGRHDLGVLAGSIAHRRRTVGVCVCKLHLQTQKIQRVDVLKSEWSLDGWARKVKAPAAAYPR
jgi:hypothetical protein